MSNRGGSQNGCFGTVLTLVFALVAISTIVSWIADNIWVCIAIILVLCAIVCAVILFKKKKQGKSKDVMRWQTHIYGESPVVEASEISPVDSPASTFAKQEFSGQLLNVLNDQLAQKGGAVPNAANASYRSESTSTDMRKKELDLSTWYISVSFGRSSSQNYLKAVTLAKSAPQYHEQIDDGNILHQAFYSAKPKDFLNFVMLYELVSGWKSSFAMINGEIVDRKIIGRLNYCYGDKCRSNKRDFCFGASFATENPFGCHRIQVSAWNNPWWTFYKKRGAKYALNKKALLTRINDTANVYCFCPAFDRDRAIAALNALPDTMSQKQYMELQSTGIDFGSR